VEIEDMLRVLAESTGKLLIMQDVLLSKVEEESQILPQRQLVEMVDVNMALVNQVNAAVNTDTVERDQTIVEEIPHLKTLRHKTLHLKILHLKILHLKHRITVVKFLVIMEIVTQMNVVVNTDTVEHPKLTVVLDVKQELVRI